MNNSENFYKRLAADYVLAKSAELSRELSECASEPAVDEMTTALKRIDAKLHAAILREKETVRRKRFVTWGALAASFLFVVFAVSLVSNLPRNIINESAPGRMATDTAAPANGQNGGDTGNEHILGVAEAPEAPPPSESTAEESEADTDPAEIPPLLVHLSLFAPDGWQTTFIDYDGDIAIYHLQSSTGNRVAVLAGEPIYDPDGGEFREIFINNTPAYMRVESTYSILFFERNGLQLILSTDYEYEDLITLAEFWI
ncbi:MAG: hypothetical protein LBI27_00230 [Clostridiales bacterium]|jgi:hypothetical protein|nr:hypothetical protein [Clostridiales bacterium]